MKIGIKQKLFATLLLTSLLVASGMFLFMQWSFDRGFLNYVNDQELAQLDQLSVRLTDYYAKHDGWLKLVKNPRTWHQLQQEPTAFLLPTNRDHPRDRPALRRPPPPDEGRNFAPRIVLFDANKEKVIGGPPGGEMNIQLRPFSYQNRVVGYLGLIPLRELTESRDLLFVEQQTESFALIALAMVTLSLLLSYPLASQLLRPIKALMAGTQKLISGHFKTRIAIKTKDELGQLSQDFNSLANTLEKNEQARRQWVVDISHELRTPLSVLRGQIEALQDGIRQPGPQTYETLHHEALHLGRLVDDLYELSLSDVGALTYKKIKVSPLTLLTSALELYETRFDAKGLKLAVDLPKSAKVQMLADPDRLQQLFTNLLENSLRYTDAPGELRIDLTLSKESLTLQFQDTKPGVSSDQLPRLFERLYRVESSRNREKGGAGLGLSICRNIVEAHQGKIEARSASLGGVSITVILPLC